MRNALPWIGFLLLVPILLYIFLGGMERGMADYSRKIDTCKNAGGVLTRNGDCVQRIDIERK